MLFVRLQNFKPDKNISYATQSGPMLVINDRIHPVFVKDSKHYNIRNGVGVLPNGELLFAMSKDTITFHMILLISLKVMVVKMRYILMVRFLKPIFLKKIGSN